MSNPSIHQFIAQYTDAAYPSIACQWVETTDADGEDQNYAFRLAVLEAVIADAHAAPVDLIRDLFLAETALSVEAWSVDPRVEDLAILMLQRGRGAMLTPYLEGRSQSFDAYCACSGLILDTTLSQGLIHELEQRLTRTNDADEQASLTEVITSLMYNLAKT